MRHVRMLGLCLIAMFIVTAVAASGASAAKFEPEWGQCVQTENGTGGHYGNAGCTAQVKPYHHEYLGGYEWYPHEVAAPNQGGGFYDRQELPQPTTLTFDGFTITCPTAYASSKVGISGPKTTLNAPFLGFVNCSPSESSGSVGNVCWTTEFGNGEPVIGTEFEWDGIAPHTWNGTLTILEGKKTLHPIVGYVWKTSPAGSQFFEQVDCEGAPVVSFEIGGAEENEAIVTTIEPVNTMSESHTLSIGSLAHKVKGTKPLMVLANGKAEPISIKSTMVFPETEIACSDAEQVAGLCNGSEEELKATP